jgi:TonB family protein
MTLLLAAALRATLALVLGLGLRAALRRQPAGLRHALLAATLMAAPVVAAVAVTAPGIAVPLGWPAAAAMPGVPAARGSAAVPVAMATVASTPTAPPAPAPVAWPWPTWMALAWAAGAIAAAAVRLAGALRLRRRVRTARPVRDDRWTRALRLARDAAAIQRPVDLRCVPDRSLLATWGWRHPRIVIPEAALGWDDARIATVLAHELAHVRRHDWLVQSAADAACALLWWNPLAWLAARRLRDDAELACDDAVLGAGVAPAAYAEHLLQIARACGPAPRTIAALPMARPSTLERRIVAMLSSREAHGRPTRRMTFAAGAALLAVLLPVAVLRAQAARQPLEGVVYDPTGAVLPGVKLTLETGAAPLAARAEAVTDQAGRFVFDAVDPGRHALQATVPGFGTFRQDLDLKEDSDWRRAITLQVGTVRESITVRGRRPAAVMPLNGPGPVRVGGNIRAPRKVKNVLPIYPERMRDAGLEGIVQVEAIISVNGGVTSARVVSASVHPDFAIAAIDAVRQWQFEPTLLNGRPVEVVMTVSIDFGLE